MRGWRRWMFLKPRWVMQSGASCGGQVDPRHGNDGHPRIGCSSNRLSEAPFGEANDRRSVPVDSERIERVRF
jgi:hypothetical protein